MSIYRRVCRWYFVHGVLIPALAQPDEESAEVMIRGLLNERQLKVLEEGRDLDFSLQTSDGNRQRVNVFRQQGKPAATIRLLNSSIPTLEQLHL